MKRTNKSNRIIAICLCAVIILTGVGIGLAREQRDERYQAPSMTLLAGQLSFDLLSDVTYNADTYELSVYDLGGFDVTRPGTYQITYALTPVPPTGVIPPAEDVLTEPVPPSATVLPTQDVPLEGIVPPVKDVTPETETVVPAEPTTPEVVPAEPTTPEVEIADAVAPLSAEPAPQPAPAPEANPAPVEPTESVVVPVEPAPVEPTESVVVPVEPAPEAETIYFTRTVVVTAVVEYADARLELGTDPDLLAGVDYDQSLYTLALTDDGALNRETVGEYSLTYTLSSVADGTPLCSFRRYAQVTLPGVAFENQTLPVSLNRQDYDLATALGYDAERYTLSLLDGQPDFDSGVEGVQRVLFSLTELPADAEPLPTTAVEGDLPADAVAPPSVVAAIFGRDVVVSAEEHAILFDAPPLVIIAGGYADIDLLDGVTATDENGDTVELVVQDRTQLDDAQASADANAADENTADADANTADADANTADAAANDADANTDDAPKQQPRTYRSKTVNVAPPSVLPDALEPGEYTVTLAATHAASGEVFTTDRKISVLAATPQLGEAGPARNITASGQYYIDVSKNPEPLNITAGVVTLYLSGTGAMQYDNFFPTNIWTTVNGSSIQIGPSSRVVLVLEAGADVTTYAKNGVQHYNQDGSQMQVPVASYPAIKVIEGGSLHIMGAGKLTAIGGGGTDGGTSKFNFAQGGGAGAGAGIGSGGGAGGRAAYTGGLGNPAQRGGSIHLYTSQIIAQGGAGGDGGGGQGFGGGGGGYPAAGIGGGGAGGGGGGGYNTVTTGTQYYIGGGGGGFSGGGGYARNGQPGRDGASATGDLHGEGFFSQTPGMGGVLEMPPSDVSGGNGGIAENFGAIVSHYNGAAAARPTATYGSLEILTDDTWGLSAPEIADKEFFFYGMGAGVARTNIVGNLNPDPVDIINTELANSTYNTSYNPAPPLRVTVVPQQWKANLHLEWEAPDAMDGYAIPTGYVITGYQLKSYTEATLTPSSIPAKTLDLTLGDLTTKDSGRLAYDASTTEFPGKWVTVSTVIAPVDGTGTPLQSVATPVEAFTVLVSYPDKMVASHQTIAEALAGIQTGAQTGSHRITFTTNYTMVTEDYSALETFSGNATEIIIDGRLWDTDADKEITDAAAASFDLTIGGNIGLPSASVGDGKGAFTFQHIGLNRSGNWNIHAKGNALTIGEGVIMKGTGAPMNIFGGAPSGAFGGNTSVAINSDGIYGTISGGNERDSNSGNLKVQLNSNITATKIATFDELTIAPNKIVTVQTGVNSVEFKTAAAGVISFGAMSTLSLPSKPSPNNKAGRLVTTGAGATLEMVRGGLATPLTLNNATPNDMAGGALILKYSGTPTPAFAIGDKLLEYSPTVKNADASHYLEGFGLPESLSILVNKSTGSVYIGEARIRLTAPGTTTPDGGAVPGAITYYNTLEEAFAQIKTKNADGLIGDYEVALLKDYVFTIADRDSLLALKGLSTSTTIKITGKSASSDTTFQRLTSKVEVLPPPGTGKPGLTVAIDGFALPMGSADEIGAKFVFENMDLNVPHILAQGSSLELGVGLTMSLVPNVLGGAIWGPLVGNSRVVIKSGSYAGVYGGGIYQLASVPQNQTGDTHVVFEGGEATKLSGGGNGTQIHGNIQVTVKGGTIGELEGAGSYGTPAVYHEGNATVNIEGGEIKHLKGATFQGEPTSNRVLNINAKVLNLETIAYFTALNLGEGATVAISSMNNAQYSTVTFGAKSTLKLPNRTELQVKQLTTAGEGATLQIKKFIPLPVWGTVPLDVSKGKLTLRYLNDVIPAVGDVLLKFENAKENAKSEDYIAGFVGFPEMCIAADKAEGKVKIDKFNIRLTAPGTTTPDGGAVPGAITYYNTLEEAFAQIKTKNADGLIGAYEVALIKDYVFTTADQDSLLALKGLSTSTTIKITGKSAPSDTTFQRLTSTVPVPPPPGTTIPAGGSTFPGIALPMGSADTIGAKFIFENMTYSVSNLFAQGSSLEMGLGLTTSDAKTTIHGGAFYGPFAGDSRVVIESGKYDAVYGGGMLELSSTGINQTGDTYVIFQGGTTSLLSGGGFGSLVDGHVHVTVTGGTIERVEGANGYMNNAGQQLQHKGDATVNIEGGAIKFASGATFEGEPTSNRVVNFKSGLKLVLEALSDFTAVNLGKDATVTVTRQILGNYGTVNFGANSTLSLGSIRTHSLKQLTTAGEGATLQMTRGNYRLNVMGTEPLDVSKGKLTLNYVNDVAPVEGDILLSFPNAKLNAKSTDYLSGFTKLPLFYIEGNGINGEVRLAEHKVRLTTPDGTATKYSSMARALDAIKAETPGAYEIALLKDYTFTSGDATALAPLANLGTDTTVTITGKSAPEQADNWTLNYGVDFVRSANIQNTAAATLVFENIKMTAATNAIRGIYAAGSPLVLGDGITMVGNAKINVYGGTDNGANLSETQITVKSGTFNYIYGGNKTGNSNTITANISIANSVAVNGIYNFDSLTVAPNMTLTMNGALNHAQTKTAAKGILTLETGAKLILNAEGSVIGGIVSKGTNAITVPKTGRTAAAIQLANADAVRLTNNEKIVLNYPEGAQAVKGNRLIGYKNAASELRVADFDTQLLSQTLTLLPDTLGRTLYLSAPQIRFTPPGGTSTDYETMAYALQRILNDKKAGTLKSGEYTIALLTDYEFISTSQDQTVLSAIAGLPATTTVVITGRAKGDDIPMDAETKALSGGPITLPTQAKVASLGSIRFEYLTLLPLQKFQGLSIFASGTPLVMGEGITTVLGQGVVTLSGGDQVTGTRSYNSSVVVKSGTYENVFSWGYDGGTTFTHNGNSSVTIDGGEVRGAVGIPPNTGSSQIGLNTVTINGGAMNSIYGASQNGRGTGNVFINASNSAIITVVHFDQLNIKDGITVSLASVNNPDKGTTTIGAGATLAVSTVFRGNALATGGEGATLQLPRSRGAGTALIQANAVTTTEGRLILKYADGEAAALGDSLITCSGLDTSWFIPGFVPPMGDGMAFGVVGYNLCIVAGVVRLTASSGAVTSCVTMADALKVMKEENGGTKSGEYVITLLKDYTFTYADQQALTALGTGAGMGKGTSLKITGKNGDGAVKSLSISSLVEFPLQNGVGAFSGIHFEHLTFSSANNVVIYASGSPIVMGDGLTMASGTTHLYGADATRAYLGNVSMEIRSGTYGAIDTCAAPTATGTITIAADVTASGVYDFTSLNIEDGATLTNTGIVNSRVGTVTVGQNATLVLGTNVGSVVKQLIAGGDNSTLELRPSGIYPLEVCGTEPIKVEQGPFVLKYADGVPITAGDKLLQFTKAPSNAKAADYLWVNLPGNLRIGADAEDAKVGWVYLFKANLRLTSPVSGITEHETLVTVCNTIKKENLSSGHYEIALLEDYSYSPQRHNVYPSDLTALLDMKNLSNDITITFTGKSDAAMAPEHYKAMILRSEAPGIYLPQNFGTGATYTFENIELVCEDYNSHILTDGNDLIMGEGITVTGTGIGTMYLYGGGLNNFKYRASTITVKSGTYRLIQGSYESTAGGGSIRIETDLTLEEISDFDSLTIAPGKRVTVTSCVNHTKHHSRAEGVVTLGKAAELILNTDGKTQSKIGKLVSGGGNTLALPHVGTATVALLLEGKPAVDMTAGHIILKYGDGKPANGGDLLLWLTTDQTSADAKDYINGFEGYTILASKSTGNVYLGSTVTVKKDGGAEVYHGTLAGAMAAIGAQSGNFVVTIRKQNYELTAADALALDTHGKNATALVFTGKFTTTKQDPLEPGEAVGITVTRTVKLAEDLSFHAPTTMNNIRLEYTARDQGIYANGKPLTTANTMEVSGALFPTVYGGSKSAPTVGGTKLTLNGGKFSGIFGGGKEATATVNGDTEILFGDATALHGHMYGGGDAGSVTGSTSVIATGGTALDVGATHPLVVAGGRTGAVGKDASVAIRGGVVPNVINFAGSDRGNVVGNVTLSILGNPLAQAKADKANLYGGGFNGGTVGGSATIAIQNGKDYGVVSGGGNSTDAATALASVTGDKIINLTSTDPTSSLQIETVVAFSTLNLRYPASGITDHKTAVVITKLLDSVNGQLNFFSGAALSLPAADGQRVGSIATDNSLTTSHLHIGRDGERTYPLYIAGGNVGDPASRLLLGMAVGDGKLKDKLLVFADAKNANAAMYIAHANDPGIIVNNAAKNEIIYGNSEYPQIKLDRVSQGVAADVLGTTVEKTLSFTMTNDDEFNENVGDIQSGYVNTNYESDDTWEANGNMPQDAAEITITKNADVGTAQSWKGTVTMDMTQPMPNAPVYYFAHVRSENGTFRTVVLDVNSPIYNKEPVVGKTSNGDYTFAVSVKDPLPDRPAGVPAGIGYTASGVYQAGWSVGDAPTKDALAYPMVSGANLKGVVDAEGSATYTMDFTVPAADLAGAGVKTMYLYVKDMMGNTRAIPIIMDEHLIDVTIPLKAGVIAIKGGDGPRLITPTCYLVNQGSKPVTAYVTAVEVPANNTLKIVAPKQTYGNDEINLQLAPVAGETDSFTTTSVVGIDAKNQLRLGKMGAATDPTHGVSFQFSAAYNHQNITETGAWSYFTMSYRFAPVVVPTPIEPIVP